MKGTRNSGFWQEKAERAWMNETASGVSANSAGRQEKCCLAGPVIPAESALAADPETSLYRRSVKRISLEAPNDIFGA